MIDSGSLQKYSLFGGMLPEQIERIRHLMVQSSHPAGGTIVQEGTPNDRIYFILEGRVEVTKDGCLLSELGEGDAFGEMELLDVQPSAATIRALTMVSVAAITNRAIHEIYSMDPKAFSLMIMNLARELSRRLRRMDAIAAELSKARGAKCPPYSFGSSKTSSTASCH
jgi:CRP/FNR family transcriptional regulator, cyclic AMP receptor protein